MPPPPGGLYLVTEAQRSDQTFGRGVSLTVSYITAQPMLRGCRARETGDATVYVHDVGGGDEVMGY